MLSQTNQALVRGTLAALPEFQDCYVDCLTFEEDAE